MPKHSGKDYNVGFFYDNNELDTIIRIRAMKDIAPYEELYIAYGDFWAGATLSRGIPACDDE